MIRFCFERLGVHRVEAACIPTDEASRGVLLKCGFKQEGMARAYLRINGVWRGHILFGLLSPAPARTSGRGFRDLRSTGRTRGGGIGAAGLDLCF